MSVNYLAEILRRRPEELQDYLQGLQQMQIIVVDPDGKVRFVHAK